MTKESKKIEQSIEQLKNEQEKLNEQLKPIPQGKLIQKFQGISLITGQEKYKNVLTLNDKPINYEDLTELIKQAKEYNLPKWERLKEIDKLLPILEKKLNDAKVNDLLLNERESNKINELELIDNILKVVLENEIKQYSLRNLEKFLNKNGMEIDHSTLGGKFKKANFRLQIIASIMRKKDSIKKTMDREKLDAFKNWIDINYMKGQKIHKKNSPGKSIGVNDELTDREYLTDRKSGKSGIHPGLSQDELIDNMDFD